MGTYDYTGDGNGTIKADFYRKSVLLKRVMKVADIIASDTTLTANAKITAADVIQMIDVPAKFVLTNFFVVTVTPEGAALTADFGIAGSTELASNFSINQAAGTITLLAVGASWGADNVMGYAFAAADTIDMTFDSDTDAGEWDVYIAGWFLD